MYIGKQPIVGNFQKCDALTASATADYTLQVSSTNVVPESANHMLVSLNGILQAPITSFTVSGSTLSFASALTSSDSIDFVILLGNVLDIGTPSDGTVSNAKLGTDVISGETDIGGAIADADLILLDDGAGGTLRKSAMSRIATYIGTNTPAFEAKMTGVSTALTEATLTTLTVYDSEDFDTDNCFDPSTGKFTPTVAGKYFIEASVLVDRGGATMSDVYMAYLQIFQNGSSGSSYDKRTIFQHDMRNNGGRGFQLKASGIFDMNGSSDYVYTAVYLNTSSNNDGVVAGESNYSWFRGFKLIGA